MWGAVGIAMVSGGILVGLLFCGRMMWVVAPERDGPAWIGGFLFRISFASLWMGWAGESLRGWG